nr:VOC family protein [Paenibacillus sp. UNC496MF]
MDRAISWYTDRLGFRLSSRDGDRIAFLTLPERPLLMLWQTDDDSTNAHCIKTMDSRGSSNFMILNEISGESCNLISLMISKSA